MLILIFFVWIFYYLIKGVHLREDNVRLVLAGLTFGMGFLELFLISFLDAGFIKVYLVIYFLVTMIDYFRIEFLKKEAIKLPYFSRLYLQADEAVIHYTIFRPIIVLLVDIFLYLTKKPLIGLEDEIAINIKSKNNQKIDIIL